MSGDQSSVLKGILGIVLWLLAAIAAFNAVAAAFRILSGATLVGGAVGAMISLLTATIFVFVAYWLLYAGCWARNTWGPVRKVRSLWHGGG